MRRVLSGVVLISLALVLLEIALRISGARNVVLYTDDPEAGYRVTPMQDVRRSGIRVVINEWGARDTRPFLRRNPGTRRILVLGGSLAWGGTRIRQEDLFTAVLEQQLPDCEVINAGVSGYSTAQMAALYRRHLAGLDPDLILVVAGPEDFERPPVTRLTGSSAVFPLERPRWALPIGWATFRRRLARRLGCDWFQGGPATVPDAGQTTGPHQIQENVTALRELEDALGRDRNLRVVLCPDRALQEDRQVKDELRRRLSEAGIAWTDIRDHVAFTADSYQDDVHLSQAGHADVGAALADLLKTWRQRPMAVLRVQEDVYSIVPPDNGSGPLWSYGNTQIVRTADRVLISQMETGEGVPPLCNTRWKLLERTPGGWGVVAAADEYRQREPCPLAVLGDVVYLNVNDSTEPPGTRYGPCEPALLRFDPVDLKSPQRIVPDWGARPHFTDHSYRGFAADRDQKRLLMLNIDARTSQQHWCYITADGSALQHGAITFPIRASYPQAALRGSGAHVLAIGDIVEPVEEWRQYKFEQTGRQWDYVFRILYYAWTPDIMSQAFAEPIEIANVDKTAGAISNQDMWVSPQNVAYLLYTERAVQSPLMRDRFFPDLSVRNSLNLAIVSNGQISGRHVLLEGDDAYEPAHARFHETPDGRVFAVVYLTGARHGNYLVQVYPELEQGDWTLLPVDAPFTSYCLATVRAGCAPSYTIDMHGYAGQGNVLSYAAIEIR